MRESLKTGLSDRFANEVLLPSIQQDYTGGMREMLRLNEAYAVMLVRQGLLSREEGAIILNGLDMVREELTEEQLDGKLEDLYFNVERRLFRHIGSTVGGKLHAGRSRNDIHATMERMIVRKQVLSVIAQIMELQQALLRKAAENTETVMTGYTHFQPGQPTTLAHYYLAIFQTLARDVKRLFAAYENTNQSPYGAAAFAGTGFDIDTAFLAKSLGFSCTMENTLDAIASRDYYLEVFSAMAIAATTVSRMAEDLYFWATFENGILEIDSSIAICSSIMPQKRNPITLEYAKAKSAHAVSALMGALTTLKSCSYSNVIDLFELPILMESACENLRIQLICMTETVKNSRIRERAGEQAAGNLCTVTGLADYLVQRFGVVDTAAHDNVGKMAAAALEDGSLICGFTPELLKKVSAETLGSALVLSEEELRRVLSPWGNVESKRGVGSPNPEAVRSMIGEGRGLMDAEQDMLSEYKTGIAGCYLRLDQAVRELKQENGGM